MIIDLKEVNNPSMYGKKAVNLKKLYSNFDVPKGFVISSEEFSDIIGDFSAEDLKEKRAHIINSRIPERIESVIKEKYENLIRPEGIPDKAYDLISGREVPMVAVRPSMIPFKKSLGNAFLNVHSSQSLLEAVKKCAASFFSKRAQMFDLDGMGIIVQKMVDVETSGFVYSSHPTDNGILIESNFGFGQAISEGVPCDRFVVKDYGIEQSISKKKLKQVSDNLNGKTRQENILDKNSEKPSLSERKVKELAKIAKRLEKIFGTCFFEFGKARDKIFIFQCNSFDKKRREEINGEKLGEGICVSLGKAEGEVSFTEKENKIFVSEKPDIPKKTTKGIITRRGNFSSNSVFISRQLDIPYIISKIDLRSGQSIKFNYQGIFRANINETNYPIEKENTKTENIEDEKRTSSNRVSKVMKLIDFYDGEALGDGAFVRNVGMDTLRNINEDYGKKKIWYLSDIYEASDPNIENIDKDCLIERPAGLMGNEDEFIIVDINKINSAITGYENQDIDEKTMEFIKNNLKNDGKKTAINFKVNEKNVYNLIKTGFDRFIVPGSLIEKIESIIEKCERRLLLEIGRKLL